MRNCAYDLLPEVSKDFCQHDLERNLEDDKASCEKGSPSNFNVNEVSDNDDVKWTDNKVWQKYKCLKQ